MHFGEAQAIPLFACRIFRRNMVILCTVPLRKRAHGPIFEVSVSLLTQKSAKVLISALFKHGYIENEGSDESLILHRMPLMAAVSSGRGYGR